MTDANETVYDLLADERHRTAMAEQLLTQALATLTQGEK